MHGATIRFKRSGGVLPGTVRDGLLGISYKSKGITSNKLN
jgi:hypothetical protein